MKLEPGYYWYNNNSWDGEPDGIAYLDKTGRWQYPGREHFHGPPAEVLGQVMSRKEIQSLENTIQYWIDEFNRIDEELFWSR